MLLLSLRNASRFAVAALPLILSAVGCSSPADGSDGARVDAGAEAVGSVDQAIIGGVGADPASLNAVGALVGISRYNDYYPPYAEHVYYNSTFCSATLIAPNAVLTTKGCVASLGQTSDFGFAIGPDARNPTRVIPVAEFEVESTVKGGHLTTGSDIAILHLEASVTDVTPLAVSALDSGDVGKRLAAIGFGSQTVTGSSSATGVRRAGSVTLRGTEGKVLELAFGSFDAFKAKVSSIYDYSYQVGDVTTPDGAARARTIYDSLLLIPGGYEAAAGNLPGDAQICDNDLGGPLVRRVDGKNTVFGVSSWTLRNNSGYYGGNCDFVNVFATLGPATQAFVTKALTWVDPCGGASSKGSCDGDVAVRCSAKTEGARRILRTDCADLGLTCSPTSGGQVACVDP